MGGRYQYSHCPPHKYPTGAKNGARMVPTAERIDDRQFKNCCASKDLCDTSHDFLATGPALRILQLNVKCLSARKPEVISCIAGKEKTDIICLEETHVKQHASNHCCNSLHVKYCRATCVRQDRATATPVERNWVWETMKCVTAATCRQRHVDYCPLNQLDGSLHCCRLADVMLLLYETATGLIGPTWWQLQLNSFTHPKSQNEDHSGNLC